MKHLTTRTEIANEINIKRTPTVVIDLADSDDYGLKSKKVLIDNGKFRDGSPYLIRAEVRAYCDERKFTFTSHGACLTADFGYSDLVEMAEYANAPVIRKDSDVVIVVLDSNNHKMLAPVVLHTGNRIDAHCSTPLTFVDGDNDALPYMAYADDALFTRWAEIYKTHHN